MTFLAALLSSKRLPRSLARPSSQRTVLPFSTAAVVDEHDDPPTASDQQRQEEAQQHPKYPRLFAPLDLGPDIGILPNRALMGSMHSGLEGHSMPRWMVPWLAGGDHDNEESLDAMAAYFAERAEICPAE